MMRTAASDGLARRSILVVEHEALAALDIQSSLVAVGYEVPTTAASAAEALEAVEIFHPDLILMDVRLEEGDDGIAAAAAIRARHPTPIVFLTSHCDDATLTRAQMGAQPNGYVLKPYQDRDLHAAVEVALQRHALERETSQQRSLLAGVLSGMSDAVAAADLEGNIVLVNDAGRRAFGKKATTGGALDDDEEHLIYLADQETLCGPDQLPLTRALRGEFVRDVELFVLSHEQPNGRWYSVNATPLLGADGRVYGAVAVGRDVTELRAARSELQQLSQTDSLTGTYNRRGFMQVARAALENARQSGRQPAVVFIDLNGMKRINDSLGHYEGDRLLMDVAWILRTCFRTSDIVGRIGGDEFVVLAPDAGGHADALPERLRASVDDFNAGSERAYRVSVSIGLCRCDPGESVALEDLVEQADRRMYEDKLIRGSRRTAPEVEPDHRQPGSGSDEPAASQPSRSARRLRRTSDVVSRAIPSPPLLPLSGAERGPVSSPPSSKPPARPTSRWPRAIGTTPTRMTPKRLLLVDDEARNLALFERLLVPLGHELVRAEDGESAIAAFDKCRPDLVLLDLVLPGVDGIGVLAHIRAHSVDDHVPVVVLTAHSEVEHRLLALEAGADDFLEKPADGRSLRARVTTLLQLKDSRDALRHLNEELELRHAALNHLQREQRDLMAFVVHDLKSPLAAVSSNLGFAQASMSDEDATVKEALQDAANASRRLSAMIDDLLILSRLEDSELPLHNETIQVSDLLRDVFGEYARRAAEKHVKLLTPDLTSSSVVADRGLLQRVIENLLDNSLRYTPEHGRVHIATRANGKVEIAVSNSGPSIPLAERQRIFEKFARIETVATTCGNAGLGLYFCKRAIEALGGDIEVTETPEWPTSFVLHLPASS